MENENIIWEENPQNQTEAEKNEIPVESDEIVTPVETVDSALSNEPEQTVEQDAQPAVKRNPKKKKKDLRKIIISLLSVLLVVALTAAGCGLGAVAMNRYWDGRMDVLNQAYENKLKVMQEKLDSIQNNTGTGTVLDGDIVNAPHQVYAQNVQAVVAISNQSLSTNIYGQVSETASSGTGFIVSEDGYVVTNFHVVDGATKLVVITSNGQEYEATLVGYESINDIAVLKIQASGLPYVTLGSSDALQVGELVMAIGNPLGELTSTLTVGYVSAKNRVINTDGSYLNMLQTDAAINSGNSGGPLFNAAGQVVGVTTAKYSGTSASGATIEGIGFAIPIDDTKDLIDDLVTQGFVRSAYLGVMVRDMDASVAESYGLPMGAYVDDVTKGSCADKAGIQAKDIIVNLGGYDVGSIAELTRILRRMEPGESTTISVFRGGSQVHLTIVLDEKPQTTQPQTPETTTPTESGKDRWFDGFGG